MHKGGLVSSQQVSSYEGSLTLESCNFSVPIPGDTGMCASLALPTRVSLLFVNRGKDFVRTNLNFVVNLIFPQNTYRIFTNKIPASAPQVSHVSRLE